MIGPIIAHRAPARDCDGGRTGRTWRVPATAPSLPTLVESKGALKVTVCLPARDEEATVGAIVGAVVAGLVETVGLVDEVVVVDDGSSDATADVARAAGATVASAGSVLADRGVGPGKGQALWKAVFVATGDLVVFCDADLQGFDPGVIPRLLAPLLGDGDVRLVKGFHERALAGVAGEGGRVTELVARPLLSLLFPELADIRQPLAGEYAAHREVLEALPFVEGYGVDLGLLLDVCRRWGRQAVAEVDLGRRTHRNRTLAQLGAQATDVMRTALDRAGMTGAGAAVEPVAQLPPLVEVDAYRDRRSATTSATHSAVRASAASVPNRPTSEATSTSSANGGSSSSSTSPTTTSTRRR
jgi:glucosyl-3-phosphoglycerate synthase